MRLAVIVPFLNEEAYLGILLESLEGQTRPPDRLLLVDDGSSDGSVSLAEDFAARHEHARVLKRPSRPAPADRLAGAAELEAFAWAVEQLDEPWDVVAKLDADLLLTPETFAELERRLEDDPRLGIAGAYLSVEGENGRLVRERCPPGHVRGATKFYRRACFEQVFPVPHVLGWDTIDEVTARMHGWRTQTFAVPSGDPVHLRPTASHDGALRAFRRSGIGTYAYGAHPLWVLGTALRRVHHRPPVIGTAVWFAGYAEAALRRVPRASRPVRRVVRGEQMHRVRTLLGGGGR